MAYWKSSSFTVEDNDKRSTSSRKFWQGRFYQSARGRLRSIAPTFRRSCALTCPVLAAIYVHRKKREPEEIFCRAQTAPGLQGGDRLRGRRSGFGSRCRAGFSSI